MSDEIITLANAEGLTAHANSIQITKGGRLTMRRKSISRATAETSIEMEFSIDGTGRDNIETGVGFFDHMLTLFTKHGLI